MAMSTSIHETAHDLVRASKAAGLTIATAESCTGGLIAAALTAVPGASLVLECGFVTYSNESKTQMLGVPAEMIAKSGAVSAEVARAMAAGALARSKADIAIAVTGIAGPDGGGKDKPVGLVHLAGARRGGALLYEEKRFGDIGRNEVRAEAAAAALALIKRLL
jgi:nicotinamide-nucleotide amidase